MMRRMLGAVTALTCVGLLSSCSLLPFGLGNSDNQRVDAEMQRIMDAVNLHDAAALKKLFSPRARENAIGLDAGLTYFLSVFPSGLTSLGEPAGGPGGTGENVYSNDTEELDGDYKVSANGKYYELHFVYYWINQDDDPHNVGLFALGVAPYNAESYTKPTTDSNAFSTWAGSFGFDFGLTHGSPGVYVPNPRFAAAYAGESRQ
jgi:uncharacterized protein DUF5104